MNSFATSGHFIAGSKGSLFALLRKPSADVARNCVLVVPPFAEEMNKSRRMVTEMTVALAGRGVASVIPDLYGTGDSGGDFADADWTLWQDDLARVCRWCGDRDLHIAGILATRLGSGLAVSAVKSGAIGPVERTVLWQPVFDGNRFLTQFLRMRIAAMLMEQDRKETLAELRAKLREGANIEVAGYTLSGGLAIELDALAAPIHLPIQLGAVDWFEIVRDLDMSAPQPSAELIQRTGASGMSVNVKRFTGESFWAATEIVVHREMIDATIDAFASLVATPSKSRAG